jgi:hypothetical protein
MKTKAEKRVEIARDVLKQIKIGRLIPKKGTWVASEYNEVLIEKETNSKLEVRDVIKNKKCNTCALGSIFISAIDKFDKLKVKDLYRYRSLEDFNICSFETEDIFKYLKRFFSNEQLGLMEMAFELRDGYFSKIINPNLVIKWGEQYHNSYDRLRAIMLNLIRNKGTFIVPKRLPSRR